MEERQKKVTAPKPIPKLDLGFGCQYRNQVLVVHQLIEMKISSSFVVWGDNEKTLILISDLKLVEEGEKKQSCLAESGTPFNFLYL